MNITNSMLEYMHIHELNWNVCISLKHRYVYIEVAKSACSTIKARLLEYEAFPLKYPYEVHHNFYMSPFVKPYQLDRDMLANIMLGDDFYRFSFVREPYSRVLSAYLEKIMQKKNQYEQVATFFDYDVADESKEVTFDQFIDYLEQTPLKKHDKHWRPQHMLLMHPLIKYNSIGRLENFDADWDVVAKNIIRPYKPSDGAVIRPHSTNAIKRVFEYYNQERFDRIYQIYRNDFELYDYPREFAA